MCRSNFAKVRSDGYLFRTSTWGTGRFRPYQVFSASNIAAAASQQRFDYVICATKVTGERDSMLHDLRSIVRPNTTLVAAQNGMGVEGPLKQAFPKNTVLVAVCNLNCNQAAHGIIEQAVNVKPHAFAFGLAGHDPRRLAADVRRRDRLVAMDSAFEVAADVSRERWRKLVVNAALNPSTALSGLDTHQLLERSEGVAVVLQLAHEACDVAAASGVELPADLPNKVVELARDTHVITPSTLQDVRKGRPLELDPIFGFLVEQAARVGASVPLLTSMYHLLKKKDREGPGYQNQTEGASLPGSAVHDLLAAWQGGSQLGEVVY